MINKIKVIVKEPNKSLEIKYIDNDYETLQGIVKGLIDVTYLPEGEDIDVICNDEYLYNGMQNEANILMPEREHVFCGPLVFAGYNPEDGSHVSLNDEQIITVMEYVAKNEVENMNVHQAFYYMQLRESVKENEME